jgi:hypothetical protein
MLCLIGQARNLALIPRGISFLALAFLQTTIQNLMRMQLEQYEEFQFKG